MSATLSAKPSAASCRTL
ncbi:UNVERIFIED_CONTAM: hypothetical protein GTU68_021438 [Idotea baltica]|nr:hypothetical protein [Idotea baltica]